MGISSIFQVLFIRYMYHETNLLTAAISFQINASVLSQPISLDQKTDGQSIRNVLKLTRMKVVTVSFITMILHSSTKLLKGTLIMAHLKR
jgi:hypothetical protein